MRQSLPCPPICSKSIASLYDYAWGCDEGDWALLRSLFSEDAELDYSSTGGPAGGAGRGGGLARVDPVRHPGFSTWSPTSGSTLRATPPPGRLMFLATVHLEGLGQPADNGGLLRPRLRPRLTAGGRSTGCARTTGGPSRATAGDG